MSRIYLVINSDLEMSVGKIASQVGHGVQYILEYYIKHPERIQEFRDYKSQGSTKIVLKAPQHKLLALHNQYPDISFLVSDAGRTEIASGSITVLAFLPMEDQLKEFKRLRLL
jgi:peptidyl-tRNA hydrolase